MWRNEDLAVDDDIAYCAEIAFVCKCMGNPVASGNVPFFRIILLILSCLTTHPMSTFAD